MTVQNYVSLTSGTPALLSPLRRAIQLHDVKVNTIANTYVCIICFRSACEKGTCNSN